MGRSVVQDWLSELSWKQQTVVLCIMRGCDGQPKDDVSKLIVRTIRSVILHNAGTENSPFMQDRVTVDDVMKYSKDMDKYPVHFVMHICFACEIIGFKHPDPEIRDMFSEFYHIIVRALHLKPETEQECDIRLYDGVDTP